MAHCCSQCDFTSNFESALMMHRQLHHEGADSHYLDSKPTRVFNLDTSKESLDSTYSSSYSISKHSKGIKLPSRTSSATRLFDKLRARICRSKTLFSHPEENTDNSYQESSLNVTSAEVSSDTPSKILKGDPSRLCPVPSMKDVKETYSCHLCSFDADRITVLDRHLLNDHKIGLENLLKLVMAKTKDGLTESQGPIPTYGLRQPYYKGFGPIMDESEFVIETVSPKIKIVKHSATNTDIKWTDVPNLNDNCRMITEELEKFMSNPSERNDKEDFLEKMQTLNECMCRFVDSSNTLKNTLTKEFASRHAVRMSADQSLFDLSLGDRETPRDWERAHSEKMERNKSKHGNNSRGDKKLEAESFYF